MRDFCYRNYIPDITERYPEGFRTFDEPCDYGYEPTYEELVADGEIVLDEEETMNTMTFNKLNEELENKGIVFEAGPTDEYETCCYLEGMYEWGFTTVTYCAVIDPIITFYDWKYQSICCVDLDDYTTHRVMHGVLSVETKYLFCKGTNKFCYDLRRGAPVHLDDIVSIGYEPSETYYDKRFYELKDGRIYYKEDGALLMTIDQTAKDALMQSGFVIIEPEHYPSNVNILNDMIVKK